MMNASLGGWINSILSITAIRSSSSMECLTVTTPHRKWTLSPANLILGSQILLQQPRLPFVIVLHKRVSVRRFQFIVTVEIRKLDALHVGVRVSRRRPSVLLLVSGEQIKIAPQTVQISRQWQWEPSVAIEQKIKFRPGRPSDSDVTKQANGWLARAMIWRMVMRAAAAGGVEEVVNRVLEVVANPLKFREYSTYSWIFYTSMEMVHPIGGSLPKRWVEYDHEEVPIYMDKCSIHERIILSMDLTVSTHE